MKTHEVFILASALKIAAGTSTGFLTSGILVVAILMLKLIMCMAVAAGPVAVVEDSAASVVEAAEEVVRVEAGNSSKIKDKN